jgi:hypothetical protein
MGHPCSEFSVGVSACDVTQQEKQAESEVIAKLCAATYQHKMKLQEQGGYHTILAGDTKQRKGICEQKYLQLMKDLLQPLPTDLEDFFARESKAAYNLTMDEVVDGTLQSME